MYLSLFLLQLHHSKLFGCIVVSQVLTKVTMAIWGNHCHLYLYVLKINILPAFIGTASCSQTLLCSCVEMCIFGLRLTNCSEILQTNGVKTDTYATILRLISADCSIGSRLKT